MPWEFRNCWLAYCFRSFHATTALYEKLRFAASVLIFGNSNIPAAVPRVCILDTTARRVRQSVRAGSVAKFKNYWENST